jgi:hypothetical protein
VERTPTSPLPDLSQGGKGGNSTALNSDGLEEALKSKLGISDAATVLGGHHGDHRRNQELRLLRVPQPRAVRGHLRDGRQSVRRPAARPRVPLGINGQSIPVVTGKVTAGWVAEGAQKPASCGSMALKTMDPKKIAAIAVVSAEVVRANPGGYMDLLRPQIAEAFAVAFDAAALHGTSSPFSTNLDTGSSTQEFTGTTPAFTAVYDDLNAGLATLVNAGKNPNGFAWDSRMEPVFNGAKDSSGRPLFLDATYTERTARSVRLACSATRRSSATASTPPPRRSTATSATGRRPPGVPWVDLLQGLHRGLGDHQRRPRVAVREQPRRDPGRGRVRLPGQRRRVVRQVHQRLLIGV